MDVAILGISSNPTRYAFLAAQRLVEAGHHVFGVNPTLPTVPGTQVVAKTEELPPRLHTLTVYVAPPKSDALADSIVGYGFSRVIFNPGSENAALAARLRASGADVVEACTLVMLATGVF